MNGPLIIAVVLVNHCQESTMPHFGLFYDVVDDFTARRTPFRGDHLREVEQARARGELLMAGALDEPPDRALLVFRVADLP
jgi:uncharacterized protein